MHPLVVRRMALEEGRGWGKEQEESTPPSLGGNSRRGSEPESAGGRPRRRSSAGGLVSLNRGSIGAGDEEERDRELLTVAVHSGGVGGGGIRDGAGGARGRGDDDDDNDAVVEKDESESERELVESSDLMYRAHMVLEDRWMSNVLDIIIAVNCGVMGQDQVICLPPLA